MINQSLDIFLTQNTIARPILFEGIGLHTGRRAVVHLLPAKPNSGITIVRGDKPGNKVSLQAFSYQVADTEWHTSLGNEAMHKSGTMTHLLAALYALGIDNLRIELDGPEIPVMDGSALPFATSLIDAGIERLAQPRYAIVVRRPVCLQIGGRMAELLPALFPSTSVSIDSKARAIGRQFSTFGLSPARFLKDIAPARRFEFTDSLSQLRACGLARGASEENTILLKHDHVVNFEGLRFRDEFVRHKILDVIGHLSLAGLLIVGAYHGHCPGHLINRGLLRLLMRDRTARSYLPVHQALQLATPSKSAVAIGTEPASTP